MKYCLSKFIAPAHGLKLKEGRKLFFKTDLNRCLGVSDQIPA